MIKDSVILTFSKGMRAIIMLIFNMVIARFFTQSLYGTYKHIMLIVNLLTIICALGIPTTISYYYSSYNKEKRNKLIGNTITILTVLSIISSTIVLVFQHQIYRLLNNPNLKLYINVLVIYVVVMIISSFLENLYISSDNSVLLGKIYIVYIIINFIALMLFTIVFKSLYILLVSTVLIELIRTISMIILINKREKLWFQVDLTMMTEQIKFAIPLGVVAIVQTINTYIDNLFISNNYTPAQYAAYANGATDIPFVGIITISVATVILPKISKEYNLDKNFNKVLQIWSESCERTAIIMYPIFWIAILFSVGYIQFVFSDKYIADSTPIFIIYLMKFPLYCTVYGNILIVLGKQKYVMYNSVIGVILSFIFNFIFLKVFGIKGPAIVNVLIQYIVVTLQLIQISRSSKVKFRGLMPYRQLIKIFIIPAVIAIPLYLISSFLSIPQWTKLIIFGVIIYITTLSIYCRLNYIDKNIIKRAKIGILGICKIPHQAMRKYDE